MKNAISLLIKQNISKFSIKSSDTYAMPDNFSKIII